MGKIKPNFLSNLINPPRHPKCKGYQTEDFGWGSDFDCDYSPVFDCDECMYGGGTRDPEIEDNDELDD